MMISDEWDRISIEISKNQSAAAVRAFRRVFYCGAIFVHRELLTAANAGDITTMANIMEGLTLELVQFMVEPGEFRS